MPRRRVRSSRLSRYAEKQSKKQFLLFGFGTIVVIILLIQFAGPILNLFGDVIFGIRGSDEEVKSEESVNEILLAPSLRGIPNATSSAQIKISGNSDYEEGTILLYVNNSKADELDLDGSKSFSFEDVDLKNGENLIKAKYTDENNESDFSNEYSLLYSSEKPELSIDDPADNSTFTRADKRINITGTTESNNSVTVNGFRAVVDNDGEFTYLLELEEGENKINITATNEAGLSTTEEITVTYRSE